jgi:hypothetical protein
MRLVYDAPVFSTTARITQKIPKTTIFFRQNADWSALKAKNPLWAQGLSPSNGLVLDARAPRGGNYSLFSPIKIMSKKTEIIDHRRQTRIGAVRHGGRRTKRRPEGVPFRRP